VPFNVQPIQMVPDYGKSQHEKHSHSKTRLPDYYDSATNVTNSTFYTNCVTASCSRQASATITSKQERPKQGE